ncbi:MAG: capsule assembly Wzi family protein [Bacteroidota bacterium]
MRTTLTIVLLFLAGLSYSQSSPLPPIQRNYHLVDRLTIKYGNNQNLHTNLKYYTRADITQLALTIDTIPNLSKLDRADLDFIFLDNNEWLGLNPIPKSLGTKKDTTLNTIMERSLADARYKRSKKPFLGIFYPTPANMLEVNQPAFQLRVNPIVNFQLFGSGTDDNLFISQRGTDLRGGLDDKIYFQTQIIDNQANYPAYVRQYVDQTEALPGAGLLKENKSSYFGLSGGYDYLISQGYLGFNLSDHLGVQFGYGTNFIGNGYRSLLLSDFAYNYLYLKLNWRVWKLHYQNIFAELTQRNGFSNAGNVIFPKKYMATHHLSFNFTPDFSIGLFETVIFNRPDQFEFRYLMPVIFYRAVEQGLGSPDNVMLGIDGKLNLFKRYQLYGQFILDELVFRYFIGENSGWWGNKYGIQLGLKAIDLFDIDHLDAQFEFNRVRPYTYTHFDGLANYVHYNQALAHPLGANFSEWLMIVKYQPHPKLFFEARYIRANTGEDEENINWGNDLLLPYDNRAQDFNNEIGQGIGATLSIIGLDFSYQVAHNVNFDLSYFYRKKNSDLDARDLTSSYFGGGIRININRQRFDF